MMKLLWSMGGMHMKRISDLYKDIDNIMSENEYHDDDTGEDVCEISEDEVYRIITTRNDYRFLTTATIKEEIHKCFTDFAYRMQKALY